MKATFGAGCFWGVEAKFRQLTGVTATAVGFSGGTLENPSYEQVCRHDTGHVEVVQIEYDPEIISYETLVDFFWTIHDPTQFDRQGPDVGNQYRSVIFYHTPEQHLIAEISRKKLQESKKFMGEIATEILLVSAFYKAEEYHQQYCEKNRL